MKRDLLICVFSLVFFCELLAQPSIVWQKNYGGSSAETPRSLLATPDGGYIMAGHSSSSDIDLDGNHGVTDYWVVKVNAAGDIEWQKNLGGSYGEYCFTIINTSDGGYAVNGAAYSDDGDIDDNHNFGLGDFWVIKFENNGDIEWERCYGGTSFENGSAIIQTSDGGFAFCGDGGSGDGDMVDSGLISSPDFWFIKTDANGEIEWQKCFGGASGENPNDLIESDDGGYVIAGQSASWDSGVVTGNHGGYDFWVLKITSTGDVVWQKSLGGTQSDKCQSIAKTADDGYYLAGSTGSNDGDVTGFQGTYDYWVVKLNGDGEMQWQNSLGGYNDDKAYSVASTLDGGCVVTGFAMEDDGDITGNHGGHDVWVVKLSSAGELEWQKSVGGTGYEEGYSIIQLADGDYVFLASCASIDGDATNSNGYEDYWLVRLSGADNVNENTAHSAQLHFSPNPFTNQTTGKIYSPNASFFGGDLIFSDAMGRIVYTTKVTGKTFVLDRGTLANGVYFYSLVMTDDGGVITGRVVVE
ncbi:MAG: T9SS type A sorting domain-containing protein [Flavobacteriales bacterium]